MKINILILFAFLFVGSFSDKTDDTKSKMTVANKIEKKSGQLRHVVLFKFKEGTSPADIQKVEAAFVALPSKIAEIKDFEWGINNSPEGLDKGFTHCFFLTFDSEEGRAVYLPHPAHKAFGKVLGPHLDDVLVLDYWTK
jgi:hypothetical protein